MTNKKVFCMIINMIVFLCVCVCVCVFNLKLAIINNVKIPLLIIVKTVYKFACKFV